MKINSLSQWVLWVFWAVLASTTVYATDSIEGYWKSIDDRTGEPLSIIEF